MNRKGILGEGGLAFQEFAIALPFLVLICTSAVDIGRALNQYLVLSEVAHQGVRFASTQYNLSEMPQSEQEACSLIPSGHLPDSVRRVRRRIIQLVVNQNIDIDNLCVWAYRDVDTGMGKNVHVQVSSGFATFFPMIRELSLNVSVAAPYLRLASFSFSPEEEMDAKAIPDDIIALID